MPRARCQRRPRQLPTGPCCTVTAGSHMVDRPCPRRAVVDWSGAAAGAVADRRYAHNCQKTGSSAAHAARVEPARRQATPRVRTRQDRATPARAVVPPRAGSPPSRRNNQIGGRSPRFRAAPATFGRVLRRGRHRPASGQRRCPDRVVPGRSPRHQRSRCAVARRQSVASVHHGDNRRRAPRRGKPRAGCSARSPAPPL